MTNEQKLQIGSFSQWAGIFLTAIIAAGGVYGHIHFLLSGHDARISASEAYREGHDRSDLLQQQQIDYAISRLDQLFTQAASRADPFTGAEGRLLRDELREIERRVDALEKKR